MPEPIFKSPSLEARVQLLQEDLERIREELSNEVQNERDRRYTLMMRIKRVEDLLHVIIQFGGVGIGLAAIYWGRQFYKDGELWGIVAIVLWVGVFTLLSREADSKKRRIEKREANED